MPLGAARLSLLAYQAAVAAGGRTAVTLTANGNAQVDTAQSKFGGASAYFDGTGDYLSASAGDVPAFGTGDFTLEYWLRLDVLGSTYGYMYWDQRPGSNGNYPLLFTDANGATNLRYFINGADRIVAPSGTLSVDTWHHIAVVRNSGTTKMYVDGVQKGSSYTDSTDYQAGRLHLGANMNGINSVNGWLDEIRASSIARYTGNFTPSTSAFVNDSDTLLLIHADGTDGSTTFTDDNGSRSPAGISAVGNAQVSTAQSQFGGASAVFDGTGDYLTTPAFDLTGDYTIECWFRVDNVSGGKTIIGGNDTSPYNAFSINNNDVYWNNPFIQFTSDIVANTWYHAAVTRSGSTVRLFADGVLQGSGTDSSTIFASGIGANSEIRIGRDAFSSYFDGYIDEVRISDTARYTSGFTVTTSAFENDEDTLLLLHMDGANGSSDFVDDNA